MDGMDVRTHQIEAVNQERREGEREREREI